MSRRSSSGVVRALIILALLSIPLLAARTVSASPSHIPGPPQVLRMSDEGVQDLSDADLDPPAEVLGANAIAVIDLIFGGLVRLNAQLKVVGDGARSWTVSNHGRTYTFHIRKNLRFADGSKVTASDFAYSINRAFQPQFANGFTDYYLSHIVGGPAVTNKKAKTVRGVRVIDPSTLRITTDKPTAAFLDQLAFSASYVVPRELIQRYGKKWTEHAVGTGPFYVKNWQHGKELDLAPNRYYWRGRPKLSEIRILFIQNPVTAYDLYKTGGLDVMGMIQFPPSKLTEARTQRDFHQVPQLFTSYIPPNEKKAPFNNVHVRRAFSFAIDRKTLVGAFLNGQYVPARGILPPGIPGFNRRLVGETFNPATARAELAKAGYPNGKGFPKVTLDYSSGDASQTAMAPVLQRMWKQYLNVNVGLDQMEQGAYNNMLNARSFQLAFISWGADYPDPQNFLSLQLQTGNGNNNGGFSNRQFDRLTRRADTMVGHNAKRYALYDRAEKIALDNAAWVTLFWGKADIFIHPTVHGLVINGQGLTAPNWATVTIR